jgi:iron complex outermembrane receptor protein
LRRAVLEAGARFAWFGQDVQQSADVSDTALTGFTGISVPLKWGIEITGSAGSGLRFPTLSERFFSGTTGRGSVIGNPLLDSERSFNIDAGFRLDSERFFASGSFFYTRIADYIERVDLEEDLYTFSNLTRGTIRGVEYEAAYLVAPGSSLYLRGHMMKGRDDKGTPLSDIPVHRFELGFQRREAGRVYYGAAWQFRDGKNDPGNGEKGIESANLLSAYFGFRPIPTINTSLVFANLLNELYYPTADRKAALAPGRSLAVRVNWALD